MKVTAVLFALFCSTAFAATDVIVSIDGEAYTCSKGGSSSSNQDCTVSSEGELDKYNSFCMYGRKGFCSVYYQFGKVSLSFEAGSVSEAANWCNARMSGQ